jgi:hypothetical protein
MDVNGRDGWLCIPASSLCESVGQGSFVDVPRTAAAELWPGSRFQMVDSGAAFGAVARLLWCGDTTSGYLLCSQG